MKVILLNEHSQNNEKLFRLTLPNRAEYADRYGIHMLLLNSPYSLRFKPKLILDLLTEFDVVIQMGSDILFTNMGISILSLIKPGMALTMGPDPCADFPVNGDFMIWQRSPLVEELFKKIDTWQDENATRFGSQDAIKHLLETGQANGLDVLPSRVLQSFPHKSSILEPVRENCFWEPGDFSIHFVGGDNVKKVIDVLLFLHANMILQN